MDSSLYSLSYLNWAYWTIIKGNQILTCIYITSWVEDMHMYNDEYKSFIHELNFTVYKCGHCKI